MAQALRIARAGPSKLAKKPSPAVSSSPFETGELAADHTVIDAWEQAGQPEPGSRPGEEDEPASRFDGSPINRYAASTPTAEMTGDVEPLPHWARQGVGLVTREESAAEIVRSLVAEAEAVLRNVAPRRAAQ
jgi:NAD(P)H-dependent flavin oxidoreductase YrpB (nitropropane dioxygenase family)